MALHSFDPKIAEKVGVNASVIYQNIVFWVEKNQANNKHMHEGRYWTYNSMRAFEELFVYLSQKQIRTALEKLVECELILVGNFNKVGYDRTKWYCPKEQMELPKKANGVAQKGEPIPDSKPDSKPDNNTSSSKDDGDMDFFERVFWSKYPKKVGKKAAYKSFKAVMKQVDRGNVHYGEFMTGFEKYVSSMQGKDLQYVKHFATWLNGEHWTDEV
jgi:hypothetical protein